MRPDDWRVGVSSIADIFESAQAAAAPAQEAEVFLRCDRGSALLLFLFFPVRFSRGAAALVSGEFSRRALAIGRRVRRWHSPRDRAAGLDHPAWPGGADVQRGVDQFFVSGAGVSAYAR